MSIGARLAAALSDLLDDSTDAPVAATQTIVAEAGGATVIAEAGRETITAHDRTRIVIAEV